MKMIYYDNLDNLVKELKEYGIASTEVNIENKILKIYKEEIIYKEIDVGFRSFSVPFFVENEIELDYKGNNEDVKGILEHICTAYTNKEIEAIKKAMPVLKDFHLKEKKI